jgi:hypothetical protein
MSVFAGTRKKITALEEKLAEREEEIENAKGKLFSVMGNEDKELGEAIVILLDLHDQDVKKIEELEHEVKMLRARQEFWGQA